MSGNLICILSGLPIEKNDYSIEHYCPKSRISAPLSEEPQNKYPAIKIINNIKGNLLPCEWCILRKERLYTAFIKWKLKPRQKQIVKQAIQHIESGYNINPCKDCILQNKPLECYNARTDIYRMPKDALALLTNNKLQR